VGTPLAPARPAVPELELPATEPGAGRYLRHIAVRSAGTVSLVRVDDVDWIAADDYYARLHVAGRTHLIREPLQRIAAKLDPRRFVRIHRSAIVNLDRVRRIRAHPQGGHEVVLHDGTQLMLSRSRRATLEAALGQSI
jgi:two-component system LytT family response regulator